MCKWLRSLCVLVMASFCSQSGMLAQQAADPSLKRVLLSFELFAECDSGIRVNDVAGGYPFASEMPNEIKRMWCEWICNGTRIEAAKHDVFYEVFDISVPSKEFGVGDVRTVLAQYNCTEDPDVVDRYYVAHPVDHDWRIEHTAYLRGAGGIVRISKLWTPKENGFAVKTMTIAEW